MNGAWGSDSSHNREPGFWQFFEARFPFHKPYPYSVSMTASTNLPF